jgi:lactate permease
MYKQVFDPVGNSLGLSTIFAVLPILSLFVLLGGLRMKAWIASLISLLVALLVAIIVYPMPVGQALDSGLEGAAFGIFPIMWIVWNAIWIFNMTEATGHFAVLRRSFSSISDDQRVQAVIIAFSFGALLEALAGFGTPVAITAVMLVALGFRPIKAASVALVANTAPVAFGAIAIPIVTLAGLTGLPKEDLGAMVGRQTPVLALFVPLILVFMVDGARGIRQAWPAAIAGGVTFAIGQFVCSNYISVELSDIIASLLSAGAIVLLMRVWHPAEQVRDEIRRREGTGRDSGRDVFLAYLPYVVVIVIFALSQWSPIKTALDSVTKEFTWPGLDIKNPKGEVVSSTTFKFNWLIAAGTLLLISGLITMLILRIRPGRAIAIYGRTLNQLKWATLTVAAVLGIAYVMNLSGQTITIGQWIAGASGALGFLAPIIGWLGTAVTGSDTSSNSLFGVLQATAAKQAGLNPTLLAAANSSGGVLGKMVSPQNLAIGAAAVGLAGNEGDLFRRVLKWSLLSLLVMCVLVYLQTTPVLSWMVV